MNTINKMKLLLLGSVLVVTQNTVAQTKIGGTLGPGDASSVLELQSTNQGLLLPRLTTAQRNAIVSPATGLIIYNTDDQCLNLYKGSTWFNMCGGNGNFSFTNCGSPTVTGTISALTIVNGVTVTLNYVNNTGSLFGTFVGGTANGLTLSASGSIVPLSNGSGSITLTLTGTAPAQGTTNVPVIINGIACNVPLTVGPWPGNVPIACGTPPGCSGGVADPTQAVAGDKICWGGFTYMVVQVGTRLWLDRNLGAQRAGTTSNTDIPAMGDLYQWGRTGDGHQCTPFSNGGSSNGGSGGYSPNTSTQATTGPGFTNGGSFITNSSGFDWLTANNNVLWDSSATGGSNNPCPLGWRVPSMNEWWTSVGLATDVFTTPLKLSKAHFRSKNGGSVTQDGGGRIWSVTPMATVGQEQVAIWNDKPTNGSTGYLYYPINNQCEKANGLPVRCIKH